jgi:hypothetical protein
VSTGTAIVWEPDRKRYSGVDIYADFGSGLHRVLYS